MSRLAVTSTWIQLEVLKTTYRYIAMVAPLSAAETGSGMFKEDGRALLIGESATAGMSSSKETVDLPSGKYSLYVSVSSNMGRFNDGKGIEGIGVIPQLRLEFDPEDLAAGQDTLIRRAEALLGEAAAGKGPWKDVPYRLGS